MEIREAFAVINEACSAVQANRAVHQRIIDAINAVHAALGLDRESEPDRTEPEATVDSVVASVPELPPD